MKLKIVCGVRIILGLIFFVFGLNGFFKFLPMPEMNAEMMGYMGALFQTGYFFPVLKVTEIACGALLLSNFFVPLALIVISPVVLHIFLAHVFIDQGGLIMGSAILVMHLFLMCKYWTFFKGCLVKKAKLS
jgi:putative oxidoreductase